MLVIFARQENEINKFKNMEAKQIPGNFDLWQCPKPARLRLAKN